ncbi:MAG: Mur ligase family protein, partial [Clostridia bacterium]
MNKLNEFKQEIKGKVIAVIGVGVSNIPAIDYLYNLGANIFAYDKCDNGYRNNNINIYYGSDYLDKICDCDYILRSPGIKPFTPVIEKKVKQGAILTSEIELLVKFAPCKIIAVTGSDGKTTTTTLISEILKQGGYKVYLGGNIGMPLFNKLDEIKESDYLVLELSSFQLMTFKEHIDISVITNISEN